jgi:hypothetical protein
VITGIEVPLELAALLCVLGMVFGVIARQFGAHLQRYARRRRKSDPLGELLRSGALSKTIDLAVQRNARRGRSIRSMRSQTCSAAKPKTRCTRKSQL